MRDAHKVTAAISAVLQYIKTEEEAIAVQSTMQAAGLRMPLFAQPPAPVLKPWGINGRQAQMQMRNLMQLKTFHKR